VRVSAAYDLQPDAKLIRLARSTDSFECYENSHAEKIAAICDSIAEKFSMAIVDRKLLMQAALIHDIGEAAMNRDYIQAKRELTVDERLDLQRHPVIGEQEAAKLKLNRAVQLLVRWHHESWDGSGYPDALEGNEIPLASRILSVADTFCSLTAVRTFRSACTLEEAKRQLILLSGLDFDPIVVGAFLSTSLFEEALTS